MDYLDRMDLEYMLEYAEYQGKFDNDTKMVEELERPEKEKENGRKQI